MSRSIEELILAAAEAGTLTKLNIGKDPDGRGWQVNVPSRFGGWTCEIRPDPVAAIRAALTPYGVLSAEEMEE